MGYDWPFRDILAGASIASLSNLLPLSVTANLGTLEAGWTAVFNVLGIPIPIAAATGFAVHLWAMALVALFGLLGFPMLPERDPEH